eukprot:COSAG01_NODE_5052_length_4523_cov_2.790009_3_plen_103_part_00
MARLAKQLGGGAILHLNAVACAFLTEIYLCNVCSCQEILRRNGRGQGDCVTQPPVQIRPRQQPPHAQAPQLSSADLMDSAIIHSAAVAGEPAVSISESVHID